MLKVLAAIQFRSRGKWRNLPYFAISQAYKKGYKTVERELTVSHVFVGFVEGTNLDSGIRIRNAEFATLSTSPVGAYCIVLHFLY